MQFKHPEFLYFLFLLIIPILVHLFQLRKFKKVPFTNVAFLKNLVVKNRKSSQLKKWLILCTRLLLLTAIILAFAQPFFSNSEIKTNERIFIYLDNSLSTNAKNSKGNTLQVAALDLINHISDERTYSFLSNSNYYEKINGAVLKDELKKIKNTSKSLKIDDVLLKIDDLKNTTENILISDFQNTSLTSFKDKVMPLTLVQTLPEQKNNISIDSVFINNNTNASITINTVIRNQGTSKKNIPIAIFNDEKLLSKQTFSIDGNEKETITFSVEKSNTFKGRINITTNDAYNFDNTFYFSVNSNEKINVLAIGNQNDFLSRIYNQEEFNFRSVNLKNTNYNNIDEQQLIILNEIEQITPSLASSIKGFVSKGGHLIIIPNKDLNISSYNSFFKQLSVGKIIKQQKDSLNITRINFNHPLFKNVFDKKVKNFQYPFVKNSYSSNFRNKSSIVYFENNTSFIEQISLKNSNIYWVAAPLNINNSNFINSPLVVPVFYNIGQQSLQLSKLYYTIHQENTIDINTQLGKDDILNISNQNSSFIPLQQTFQNKVSLTTKEQPNTPGFYEVKKDEEIIQVIAYNTIKNESILNFLNTTKITDENIVVSNSVKETLDKIDYKNKVHWLWKWFLAIAIVSLLLEILILKYFKV